MQSRELITILAGAAVMVIPQAGAANMRVIGIFTGLDFEGDDFPNGCREYDRQGARGRYLVRQAMAPPSAWSAADPAPLQAI